MVDLEQLHCMSSTVSGTGKVLTSSAQCTHSNNRATPIRHSADAYRTASATRGIVQISIDRRSALCKQPDETCGQ